MSDPVRTTTELNPGTGGSQMDEVELSQSTYDGETTTTVTTHRAVVALGGADPERSGRLVEPLEDDPDEDAPGLVTRDVYQPEIVRLLRALLREQRKTVALLEALVDDEED